VTEIKEQREIYLPERFLPRIEIPLHIPRTGKIVKNTGMIRRGWNRKNQVPGTGGINKYEE